MKNDLVSTLEHALANRTCLPAVSPLAHGDSCGHALLLYDHDRTFYDAAAGFLNAALHRGDTVTVTLTREGRAGVAQRLSGYNWDIDRLKRDDRYLEFDSVDTLSRVMRNGYVDGDALAEGLDDVERRHLASSRGPEARVTACGALSPLLCREGNFDAAIELERIGTRLLRGRPFLLLCAYSLDCLPQGEARKLLPRVCAEHAYVSGVGAGVWARAR